MAPAYTKGSVHERATARGRTAAEAALVARILGLGLAAERLATAFYYAGLTTPAVMRDPRLGGSSTDARNPGLPPNGRPSHVRALQACLDAESKHAAAFGPAGAAPAPRVYYCPAGTIDLLGAPRARGTVLGTMETLEAAFVAAYVVAIGALIDGAQPGVAAVVARILGVEAEHRVLGRAIGGLAPADELVFERSPFTGLDAVQRAFAPFLTGQGFGRAGATRATPVPSDAQVRALVGRYSTHIVPRY